jgi:pimeloyl-ACP methyl ester carboxylesterase
VNASIDLASLVAPMRNPLRSPILRSPDEVDLDYETVTFPSEDGVPLEGWYIPGLGKKLIVANHPLWFNRSGFPGHLSPWGDSWAASGNNFEVDFLPDYRHLHDAGYDVLCYDLRNFGHSGVGSGGAVGNGVFESRDVIGSLAFVQHHPLMKKMRLGLLSRCCGMNGTMVGMTRNPKAFSEVRAIVAPQPISIEAFYRTIATQIGIEQRLPEIAFELRKATGLKMAEMNMPQYAAAVTKPTLLLQVRDDTLTTPADVQAMYDAMPTEHKRLHWIEGTSRRFDAYNFLPQNPSIMLEWFDRFVR